MRPTAPVKQRLRNPNSALARALSMDSGSVIGAAQPFLAGIVEACWPFRRLSPPDRAQVLLFEMYKHQINLT
jgi:hypothetical protein